MKVDSVFCGFYRPNLLMAMAVHTSRDQKKGRPETLLLEGVLPSNQNGRY